MRYANVVLWPVVSHHEPRLCGVFFVWECRVLAGSSRSGNPHQWLFREQGTATLGRLLSFSLFL